MKIRLLFLGMVCSSVLADRNELDLAQLVYAPIRRPVTCIAPGDCAEDFVYRLGGARPRPVIGEEVLGEKDQGAVVDSESAQRYAQKSRGWARARARAMTEERFTPDK